MNIEELLKIKTQEKEPTFTLEELEDILEYCLSFTKEEMDDFCDRHSDLFMSARYQGPHELVLEGMPTDESQFDDIMRFFSYYKDRADQGSTRRIYRSLIVYLDNKEKPVLEKEMTPEVEEDFVKYWRDHLEDADETVLTLYRRYVDDLVDNDFLTGLYAKAYGCYGDGNRAFESDFKESERCLLRINDIVDDPYVHNTLGYIYYYGRIDGESDYEDAYYHFSIGSANGLYESKYKMADMFRYGYGVKKNVRTFSYMIRDLYFDNLKYVLDGFFDSKFPDVALRMGDVFYEGYDTPVNYVLAYKFYLQAQFAIAQRLLKANYYGDYSVQKTINEKIEMMETHINNQDIIIPDFENLDRIFDCIYSPYHYVGQIDRDGDDIYITIRSSQFHGRLSQTLFVTDFTDAYCGYSDEVCILCRDVTDTDLEEDNFHFDNIEDNIFKDNGYPIGHIDAKEYILMKPDKQLETHQFVSLEFEDGDGTHSEDYLYDEPVELGDYMSVILQHRTVTGRVVKIFKNTFKNMPLYTLDYEQNLVKQGLS